MKTRNRLTASEPATAPPQGSNCDLVRVATAEGKDASRERWALISTLLDAEGYEIVPDLFEHSIRRKGKK